MPLFQIKSSKVKKLLTKSVEFEKHLQQLFEANLEEILNVTFLASEYSTSSGGRIDTLGIDKNGAPVIIEYKKKQNDSVINQGLSYLLWLLDHKEKFEKLVTEKLAGKYDSPIMTYDGTLKVEGYIDWDSPRVICIAERYNKFDIDTSNILPIKVELLRYSVYENDVLLVEAESYQKVKVPLSGITKKSGREKSKNTELQKNYTVENHLQNLPGNIKKMFYALREKITSLDENILEEPKKHYIAYKLSTNFADISLSKSAIKIFLNIKSGQLNDPYGIARDLTKPKPVGHWGNGDYEIKISTEKDVEKVFELIQQSYSHNK